MYGTYNSYIARNREERVRDAVKEQAAKAKEVASLMPKEKWDGLGLELIQLVSTYDGKVELIYIAGKGPAKSASSVALWSMLQHVADEAAYAMPFSLTLPDLGFKVVRLDWQRHIVKDVVEAIREALQKP